MVLGNPPVDWSKPTKYYVMEKVPFAHEGWNVDLLYKKTMSILRDLGYLVYEARYLHAPPAQPNGQTWVCSWLRGGKEVDYFYTMTNIWCTMILTFAPKAKPGSDPKNPTFVNYGTAKFEFDAFVTTDYREVWIKSAIMRHLRPFREKYMYHDKIEYFANTCRQDVSTILDKLKEYVNYLPTIA